MRNLIARFMMNLKIEDVNNFALSKNIKLTPEELRYTYDFIKRNWEEIIKNPKLFNIERYKNNYAPETFDKIKKIYNEYLQKFANYL